MLNCLRPLICPLFSRYLDILDLIGTHIYCFCHLHWPRVPMTCYYKKPLWRKKSRCYGHIFVQSKKKCFKNNIIKLYHRKAIRKRIVLSRKNDMVAWKMFWSKNKVLRIWRNCCTIKLLKFCFKKIQMFQLKRKNVPDQKYYVIQYCSITVLRLYVTINASMGKQRKTKK